MVTLTSQNGFFGAAAGTALEYDFSQISWATSGSDSFHTGVSAVAAGGSLTVSGDYDIAVGLTGIARLDLGSMSTSLDLDGSAAVVNGDGTIAASFDTGAFALSNHALEATGPDAAESYIELGAELSLNVDVKVDAYA